MHTVATGMIPNFRVIQVFCYALVANRNNERARYVLSGIFADEPLMFFSIFSNQSTSSLEDRYFTSVLLEPRSLFLLTGDLYHNYLHGIAERTNDVISERVANLESCKSAIADTLERATRISLTIRNVPKILKFKLNLGR